MLKAEFDMRDKNWMKIIVQNAGYEFIGIIALYYSLISKTR